MKRVIVTKNGVEEIELTPEEIAQLEEQKTLQEFEQSLQPPRETIEEAEFELKLILKLSEWGIL